jgi:predicted RNase H-like nuclease (RuvC/YqgF family)
MSNSAIQEKQDTKIQVLEQKVDLLTEALRRSDSTSSALASKIAVLQQLGKIQ